MQLLAKNKKDVNTQSKNITFRRYSMSNTLKIKRFNMDLGNSMTFAMVNGDQNIIEIPTAIVEFSEARAKGYFTDDIPKSQLKESLLIKVNGKYLLVGEAAEKILGNDKHIGSNPHSKAESDLSIQMFLAAVALYDAENNMEHEEETTVQIDYFSTMLPIWEVLETEKFSDKTEEMEEKFKGEFSFEIITNGCEKTINVKVDDTFCYTEGLAAKWALRYKFDLTESETAEKFDRHITINVDLGGGTIDLVRLQKRLGQPKSRNDFKTITERPYLEAIRDLYEQKLRRYNFRSARDVEEFIVKNFENDKYIVIDGKTGEETDITEIIDNSLREYTYEIIPMILDAFPETQGEVYKYNYFGGVAPILRKYIEEYITNEWGSETFNNYHHIEPDRTARFLNLFGLEVISRQKTFVRK